MTKKPEKKDILSKITGYYKDQWPPFTRIGETVNHHSIHNNSQMSPTGDAITAIYQPDGRTLR